MSFRSGIGRTLRRVSTPPFLIQNLVKDMIPKAERSSLLRLGPLSDGGYVLPKVALDNLEFLMSPGVYDSWGFEVDVARESRCGVALLDGSMERPRELPADFVFQRMWLGGRDTETSTSLKGWISSLGLQQNQNLGLQMDIEGAEWEVFMRTPRESLRQFRFIVAEFHGFDWSPFLWDFATKIRPVFRRLMRDFSVVHVHANNCCRAVTVGDLLIPSVIEVSFVRRDLIAQSNWDTCFAEELDVDNVKSNPSLSLESWKIFS